MFSGEHTPKHFIINVRCYNITVYIENMFDFWRLYKNITKTKHTKTITQLKNISRSCPNFDFLQTHNIKLIISRQD